MDFGARLSRRRLDQHRAVSIQLNRPLLNTMRLIRRLRHEQLFSPFRLDSFLYISRARPSQLLMKYPTDYWMNLSCCPVSNPSSWNGKLVALSQAQKSKVCLLFLKQPANWSHQFFNRKIEHITASRTSLELKGWNGRQVSIWQSTLVDSRLLSSIYPTWLSTERLRAIHQRSAPLSID